MSPAAAAAGTEHGCLKIVALKNTVLKKDFIISKVVFIQRVSESWA